MEDEGDDYMKRLIGVDIKAFGDREGFITEKLLQDEALIMNAFKQGGNSDHHLPSFRLHFKIAKHLSIIYTHYSKLKMLENQNTQLEADASSLAVTVRVHR